VEKSVKICSTKLTTCNVVERGQGVTLNFEDEQGADITLQLPFEQAQAVAMTLPRLLTQALRSLTGGATHRYVFPLDSWLVEQLSDYAGLILTLAAPDGFQVSFGVSGETCRHLGWTLAHEADRCAEPDGSDEELGAAGPSTLN
jgi:hypothetical protein